MVEIRIHGRGGQGSVTAAELIAMAAFYDGKFSQAFPFFGVERRGAPVEAYARISDQFIRLRAQITEPEYIIIQDPTLLGVVDVFKGARRNTLVFINTEKEVRELNIPKRLKILTVPATQIALKNIGKPIINTALLGAFAGRTKLIKPQSIKKAISERFSNKVIAHQNIVAMQEAYCHADAKDKFCFVSEKTEIIPYDGRPLMLAG